MLETCLLQIHELSRPAPDGDSGIGTELTLALSRRWARCALVKEATFEIPDTRIAGVVNRYHTIMGICEKRGLRNLGRGTMARACREAVGNDRELIDSLRSYLSLFPGDFSVFEEIGEDAHLRLSAEFERLKRVYALSAGPSVAIPSLVAPRSLFPVADDRFGVAVDGGKQLLLLSGKGEVDGTIPAQFTMLSLLVPAADQTVWAGDRGEGTLTRYGLDGTVCERIVLSEVLGDGTGRICPVTGCLHGDEMFLQVCFDRIGPGHLAVLTRDGSGWSGRIFDAPPVTKPGGIRSVGHEVYYADRERPQIFAFDPASGGTRRVFAAPLLQIINDFVVGPEGDVFMSTDSGLAKYDREGKPLFSHLFNGHGAATSVLTNMCMTGGGDQPRAIRMSDIGLNAIHLVRI